LVVAGLVAALFVRKSGDKSKPPSPGVAEATTTTAAPTTKASAQGMTPIAANTYWIGSAKPDTRGQSESSRRQVTLPAYLMDTFEVTNERFLDFVNKNNAPRPVQWLNGQFPADQKDFPVKGVSYDWAASFCASLGKRLPKEAEWEVAARGGTDQKYPWGDAEPIARIADGGSYAVGAIPQNKSPFGLFDMAGSSWEWVSDPYDTQYVGPNDRVLRGGQNGYHRPNWTRLSINPAEGSAAKLAGFRCAASSAESTIAPWQFTPVTAPKTPAVPTPQPIPAAYYFCDDFHDPTTGWPEYSDDKIKKAYHPNRFYHLGTFGPNRVVAAKALPTFSPDQKIELSVSTETVPELTDPQNNLEYGIFVRGDAEGNGLTFTINRHPASTTWHVFQRVGGQNIEIAHNEISAAEPVTLRVRAVGDAFTFFLNDQYVYQLPKSGLTGQFVGLYLASSESSNKTHIHFSNFEVRKADDAQHTPHEFCK
jgi:formylglycine-generating enzyme required for sulfatase activity